MKFTKAQLAAMSREQKQGLLDAIAEKKRRLRDAKPMYAPNAGQGPVHQSKAMLRAVFSGNGAGKTSMACQEAMWAADGFNPATGEYTPVPSRVYIVLDKPEKVEATWLPELRKWFNILPEQLVKAGKPYINRITRDNGSFIQFMFHEQEALSFESIEGDIFIFDEPPPRHVYIGLRRAGRTKGRQARYLIIGTPLAAPWLRTDIYEPWSRGEMPDAECFKFGTAVNETNLADGYIEQFGSVLSEKEKRIRLHGEFFDLDGLALSHLFDRAIHMRPRSDFAWEKTNPCVVAIDPHPNKKHVAVLLGADKYGLTYIKEISAKATPRDFARMLKAWYKDFHLIDVVCDSLGSADMTGGEGFKSFIEVLKDEGIPVRATTYKDKLDEDWIQRIQECLQIPLEANNFGQKLPKLRFLEGNPGIVGDVETVQWVKIRNADEYKPKLDISQKDFLACLKYALATNLYVDKPHKTKPTYRQGTAYGVAVRRDKIKLNSRQLLGKEQGPRRPRSSFLRDDDD
jgi:hypothetical protein